MKLAEKIKIRKEKKLNKELKKYTTYTDKEYVMSRRFRDVLAGSAAFRITILVLFIALVIADIVFWDRWAYHYKGSKYRQDFSCMTTNVIIIIAAYVFSIIDLIRYAACKLVSAGKGKRRHVLKDALENVITIVAAVFVLFIASVAIYSFIDWLAYMNNNVILDTLSELFEDFPVGYILLAIGAAVLAAPVMFVINLVCDIIVLARNPKPEPTQEMEKTIEEIFD